MGIAHVPRPVAGIIEAKPPLAAINRSSPLVVVPPLIDGDPVERARLDVWPIKVD